MVVGEPTVLRVRLDMTVTRSPRAPGPAGDSSAIGRLRGRTRNVDWSCASEARPGWCSPCVNPARARTLRFDPPEQTAPPPGSVATAMADAGPRSGERKAEIDVGGCEQSRLDETRLSFGERIGRRFTLVDGDPLSARVDCDGQHFLERGDWRIRIELRTSMSATAESFLITKDLDAFEGDVCVHSAHHSVEIPRDHV